MPPLAEQEVAQFEQQHNVRLPEDYRLFIKRVANGGNFIWGELYALGANLPTHAPTVQTSCKFPYTLSQPLIFNEEDDSDHSDISCVNRGFIPLLHEGCGIFAILIIKSNDQATYGTVWRYDLANDTGVYPLFASDGKTPLKFLDWLETFVKKIRQS